MPEAPSSLGLEAIELAASAGLDLDPWQRAAVIDILGEDVDEDGEGRWAATTAGLIVPRQNGKGSIIEALELAWLFLCGVDLIFHSAHLFATSADAYRRIKSLIQETPDLDRQVKAYPEAHGKEAIELKDGRRLKFVTRSKSGGRGFPAPVVVLDEFFNATSSMMAALVPTMSAQENPLLLITSSHPIDDPCSDPLRRFMRAGRKGDVDRQVYIEYAATDDKLVEKWQDSPESVTDAELDRLIIEANPSYGIRLNVDVIDTERRLLTSKDFGAERLGIVDLGIEGEALISSEAWASRLDPTSQADDASTAFAFGITPDHDAGSIGVSDGRHGEVVEHGIAIARMVPRLRELRKRHPRAPIACDPSGPAGSLIADLEADGDIEVATVTPRDYAQECGALFTAITEELAEGEAPRFAHIGQPSLDAAVEGATTKASGNGGAWLWDRTGSDVDVVPLEVVTIARWAAKHAPKPQAPVLAMILGGS